jgi:hypothetical protein
MEDANLKAVHVPAADEDDAIIMRPPPARLTRFYSNIDFAKDVFQSQSITLIRVMLMNDPFDPYFEFLTDFEDRYSAILNWIAANHGPGEVRWFKQLMPYQSWRTFLQDVNSKNADFKKNTFIFCASAPLGELEPAHNLYMWGHYCAGHRGVAIEFDAEAVAASMIEQQMKIHPDWEKDRKLWTRMIYRDAIDHLTAGDLYEFLKLPPEREPESRFFRHLNTISRIKSTAWQSEQEWRLMWQNDQIEENIYKVPIQPGSIRRVIVGVRVADDVSADIAAACRSGFPDAEVVRASTRRGEFALDFRSMP